MLIFLADDSGYNVFEMRSSRLGRRAKHFDGTRQRFDRALNIFVIHVQVRYRANPLRCQRDHPYACIVEPVADFFGGPERRIDIEEYDVRIDVSAQL